MASGALCDASLWRYVRLRLRRSPYNAAITHIRHLSPCCCALFIYHCGVELAEKNARGAYLSFYRLASLCRRARSLYRILLSLHCHHMRHARMAGAAASLLATCSVVEMKKALVCLAHRAGVVLLLAYPGMLLLALALRHQKGAHGLR